MSTTPIPRPSKAVAIPVAAAVLALGLGFTAGGGTGFATGRATAPTSEACLQALNDADSALSITADALDASSRGMQGLIDLDPVAIDQATRDIDTATQQLDGVHYKESSAACRAGK